MLALMFLILDILEVCGCIWGYVHVYEVYVGICRYMEVYGSKWWYMEVNGCICYGRGQARGDRGEVGERRRRRVN